MFQQTDVYNAVSLCNTCFFNKLVDCAWSIAAAAQTGDSRHSWVIPAVNLLGFYQLAQVTFAHNGVGNIQAGKFVLMWFVLKANVVNNPIVQWTMVFKFDGAQGMGDAFQSILNWMSIVIQRIDAPFVTLTMMMCMNDTVDCRVTQVHVWRCHVDFCAESVASVREFAIFHTLEQIEIFLNRTVAVWALLTRFGQSAAVFAHLVSAQIVNICFAFFDEFDCKLIAFIKVIGTVVDTAGWFSTQPAQILFDGFYIFIVFTNRVGVVKTEIKQTAIFLSSSGIDPDCFCRTDVQVAVWFWWETGVNFLYSAFGEVFVNNIMDKVGHIFGVQNFFVSHYIQSFRGK